MSTSEPGQELELLLKNVQTEIEQGRLVAFDDLLGRVAPPPVPVPAVERLAPPVTLTRAQRQALTMLPAVYGKVVPTERRVLTEDEPTKLLVERNVLDEIGKLVEGRKDGIRITVLNHNDVLTETQNPPEVLDAIPRDKDGHRVTANVIRGTNVGTKFSIEPRRGTQSIDPAKLRDLADDETVDWFNHDDYLAMTRQERVFDENRAMLAIRANPQLVRAVREATVTASPTISVNQRKA